MTLRGYTYLTLSLLWSTVSVSQGQLPLEVGNVWQFYDDPIHPYIQTETVTGDTVLGNGHSYAVYSGILFPARFLRQEGSKVFVFRTTDSTEHTLLDFGAKIGDTVARLPVDPSWVILTGIGFDSSMHQETWTFGYGNGVLHNGGWIIVDSLGLYRVAMEPGILWYLSGARINGTVKYGSITSISEPGLTNPKRTQLFPCYPNPFNPTTTIRFYLSTQSLVSLKVYDVLGREIASIYEGPLTAGVHSFRWSGVNVNSGIYFCRMHQSHYAGVTKLVLLK